MRRWIVAKESEEAKILFESFGFLPVISQLLINRGVTKQTAKNFLYGDIECLSSTLKSPQMEEASSRIIQAINNKEKILLFGDYDVDGVASLAMFSLFLREKGLKSETLIPLRLIQGYGFNKEAVDFARKNNFSLIITLDCGTNSQWVDYATSLGIDVIVVDHHQVLKLPQRAILVNPKREDYPFSFRDLSTGVLAFKLIWNVAGYFPYSYLDLVALSLVCDVMPLVDENRILLKKGLEKIRTAPLLGLQALIETASLRKENLDTFHLGWILGPRLNASGRLSSASSSWELLTTTSCKRAYELAEFLNEQNRERRTKVDEVYNRAISQLEKEVNLKNSYVLVLAGEGWHQGVLGIVASRLKERFFRPTFLINFDKDIGKGSARSIEGFPLIEVLRECSQFLLNFGGHRKACGIEIRRKDIDKFRERINQIAQERLTSEELTPYVFIDKEIEFFQITPSLVEQLKLFPPYGEANPEPLFLTRSLKVKNITEERNGSFLVWFSKNYQDKELTYPAVVSKNSSYLEVLKNGENFDILYNLRTHIRDSREYFILRLEELRLA